MKLAQFVLIASICWLSNVAIADDDDRPEELQVLNLWAGEFDAEMTIKPGKWVTNGSHTKLKVKSEWVLNGRFLRSEGKGQRLQDGQKQAEEFMALTTYDRRRKQYVGSVFYAVLGGGADYWGGSFNVQSQSTWNAETRTMTTKTNDSDSGITVKGTFSWIDDDNYKWHNLTKDADGNIVMEQIGKGVRRKK